MTEVGSYFCFPNVVQHSIHHFDIFKDLWRSVRGVEAQNWNRGWRVRSCRWRRRLALDNRKALCENKFYKFMDEIELALWMESTASSYKIFPSCKMQSHLNSVARKRVKLCEVTFDTFSGSHATFFGYYLGWPIFNRNRRLHPDCLTYLVWLKGFFQFFALRFSPKVVDTIVYCPTEHHHVV